LITTAAVLPKGEADGIKPYTRLVLSVKEICTVRLCIMLAYYPRIMPTQENLKTDVNQSFLLTVKISLLICQQLTDEIKRKKHLFVVIGTPGERLKTTGVQDLK
jgi:hypothetical protein